VPLSAGLQFGQGMPAPPHVQACSPSQGLPGWLSQTQPQSSQSEHFMSCRVYHDFCHEFSLRPISAMPWRCVQGKMVRLGACRPSLTTRRAAELNLCEPPMQRPPLDPDVADAAPSDSVSTVYDEEHIITCLRMLDANAEGADWCEVARLVLHLDPEREPDRARKAFESHLARAKWMASHGYRLLLRGGASA
jgi:hypothetical protein